MKQVRKGRVVRFPFFKNIAFSYKESFKCIPFQSVVLTCVALLNQIINAFSPLLLTKFVEIIENGQVSAKLNLFLIYAILYIAIGFSGWLSEIPIERYYQYTKQVKLSPYFSKVMFQKIGRVNYGLFYSKDYADNQHVVNIGATELTYVSLEFTSICGTLIGLGITVATLGYLNIWAMIITIIPAAVQFFLYYKNATRDYNLTKEAEKISRQVSRYESVLKEYKGIRETKASQSNKYIKQEWEKNFRLYQKTQFRRRMSWTKVDILCSIVKTLSLIGVVAFCIFLILKGQIKIAAFAGVLSASERMFGGLHEFAVAIGLMKKRILFVDSYRTFIESNDVEELNENAKKEKFESIEFCDVSFAYPDYAYNGNSTEIVKKEQKDPKYALKNVSFKINKGERVAIVGENGSGKTTITKLIAKLYEPTSGEILFNGKPLKQANLEGYRENFSVINQEYAYLKLPLKDSVSASSNKKLSDQHITNLLKQAGADDVLSQANDHQGLSTWLTREFDGIELSGGQKQKVSIARGFAKPAEVLMVDEPTSALDPIVEKRILDNVLKVTEGKTAIVISHRLSLCTKMDRILYIENGEVVEDGPHGELMKIKNGKYRQLFTAQAKWYD